jgi:cysteine sulfinate desulfinase/cysteine desulfurase-like protein
MVVFLKVYLDNYASTRVDSSVIESMTPYFTEIISPPSSDYGYSFGVEEKHALDSVRGIIATKINVDPSEIVFTSGQAESNNFAIKGIAVNMDIIFLISYYCTYCLSHQRIFLTSREDYLELT